MQADKSNIHRGVITDQYNICTAGHVPEHDYFVCVFHTVAPSLYMGHNHPMGQLIISGKTIFYTDSFQPYIDGWVWHLHKTRTGCYARGYKRGERSGGLSYMHRVFSDAQKGFDVDHKNGNGLDNRIENLRVCNRTQNNGNRRKVKDKTSKYKGVHFDAHTGKWRAEISFEGVRYRLGRFASQEEAVQAYFKKAKELFEGFALMACTAQSELSHRSYCQ